MALLSVDEALARVLAARRAAAGRASAARARRDGRVLAADLAALRTQPPAAVSAMDGYAVRAADVARAPARLTVIGEVAAGRPFDRARSGAAKPCASSPAASCRTAPTRS